MQGHGQQKLNDVSERGLVTSCVHHEVTGDEGRFGKKGLKMILCGHLSLENIKNWQCLETVWV